VNTDDSTVMAMISPVKNRNEKTVIRRWRDVSTDLEYSFDSRGRFEFTASATPLQPADEAEDAADTAAPYTPSIVPSRSVLLVLNHVTNCPKTVFDKVYMQSLPLVVSSRNELLSSPSGYFCDPLKAKVIVKIGDTMAEGAHIIIPELQVLQ